MPLADPAIAEPLHYYERELLPHRSGGLTNAHPMEGGLATIERARDMGLVVALATNPSFDEASSACAWAGPASPTSDLRA